MTTALAAQAPWWEPGTAHGYHGVTFGHLIGEVLRRATGRDCGELIRDELAAPLGVELCMPLPAALRRAHRRPRRRHVARRHVLRPLGPEDVARPAGVRQPARLQRSRALHDRRVPARGDPRREHARERARARPPLRACSPAAARCRSSSSRPRRSSTSSGACHVRGDDLRDGAPDRVRRSASSTRSPSGSSVPARAPTGTTAAADRSASSTPTPGISLGYAMNRLWWGPDRTDPRWAADLRRAVRRPLTRQPHFSSGTPMTATSSDVGVLGEHVLDLGRIDVLAARHDHVLHAVVQEQEAVGVAVAGVAGPEPAVVVDRRARSPSSLAQ